MSITGELAAFAVSSTYETLPAEVLKEAKLLLLDTIGAIFVGAGMELGGVIGRLASPSASSGAATIIPSGMKTDLSNAIHINSSLAHSAEIDSIHPKAIVCAAGMVVPAAIALAETKKLSGKSLLTAIAIGCETAIRLGKSARGEQFLANGWWPSSVFGPLGACAAICNLEQVAAHKAAEALGIASTICGGLINGEVEGATARHFLFGWAARSGAEAVNAALCGFTGPALGLEEKKGLYLSRSVSPDFGETLDAIGEKYHLHEIVFKEFPCAMQMQSAVHGFLELIDREGVDKREIKQVRVSLPAKAMVTVSGKGVPKSRTAAAAHCRYLISAAMNDRDILPGRFESDNLLDPEIIEFMDKVLVFEDTSLDAADGKWPARIEAEAGDGRTIGNETQNWIGDGFERRKSFVYGKFRRTLSGTVAGPRIDSIIDAVENIDGHEGIEALIAQIACGGQL